MELKGFKPPHIPQKNGVDERRNQSVVAMARSIMKSKLADQLLKRCSLATSTERRVIEHIIPTLGKLCITRDVVFDEEKLWDWNSIESSMD